MRKALAFMFLLLFCTNCFAVLESDTLKVFAVTDSGKALSAELTVTLKPGNGKIWSSVEPLIGTSTQSTEKIAVNIAGDYSDEVGSYDYFFDINSNASLVEGPSAGAAMTLLVISLLQGRDVPENISLTGTITSDGGVGPVGGVFEKAKEAKKIGMKLFMIPPGESRQTVKIDGKVQSVNLVEYAERNWGLKVVEVKNIDEVLRYAFSDIEEIEVVPGSGAGLEFVPSRIELDSQLLPLKELTQKYIADAEDSLRSAKTALSGTVLDDPAMVDSMLSRINRSEKTLGRSKVLFEQNYLYSAANYAFLAMINSNFVKDVSENPALVSTSSTALESKVSQLSKEIDAFAFDLNKSVSVDYFEWHVAAKERLSWAKLKVDRLSGPRDLVITIGDNSIDEQSVIDLLDYEYAAAWFQVSKDFFGLTKDTKTAVLPDRQLSDVVSAYIVNSENGVSALTEDESEDILRRLDSAKLLERNGWMYAALFDSSSSFALVNAAMFRKNKSLGELQDTLYVKIQDLEQKIEGSSHKFVWAQLYLDHAKYFIDSSLFYEGQGQTDLSLESARSGVDLIFMAEALFDATELSYVHINSLPRDRFIDVSGGWYRPPATPEYLYPALFMVLVVVALFAVLFFPSRHRMHLLKPFSFEDRLDEILVSQRRLRKRLEKGHLSKGQFDLLNQPLQKRLHQLLLERGTISADYVHLDFKKSKVAAIEKALKEMKRQFKKKQITASDYRSNVSFYKKKIALLQHEIVESEKKIAAEKKQAEDEDRMERKKLSKKGKPKKA